MTYKKAYKQLRKGLLDEFVNPFGNSYECSGAIEAWVNQSGIVWHRKHTVIILGISKGMMYPYQQVDRRTVIKYLKENKKWKLQKI